MAVTGLLLSPCQGEGGGTQSRGPLSMSLTPFSGAAAHGRGDGSFGPSEMRLIFPGTTSVPRSGPHRRAVKRWQWRRFWPSLAYAQTDEQPIGSAAFRFCGVVGLWSVGTTLAYAGWVGRQGTGRPARCAFAGRDGMGSDDALHSACAGRAYVAALLSRPSASTGPSRTQRFR